MIPSLLLIKIDMNTSFSWNLVTKNVQEEPLLHKKLRLPLKTVLEHINAMRSRVREEMVHEEAVA